MKCIEAGHRGQAGDDCLGWNETGFRDVPKAIKETRSVVDKSGFGNSRIKCWPTKAKSNLSRLDNDGKMHDKQHERNYLPRRADNSALNDFKSITPPSAQEVTTSFPSQTCSLAMSGAAGARRRKRAWAPHSIRSG